MRSKSNGMDSPADGVLVVPRPADGVLVVPHPEDGVLVVPHAIHELSRQGGSETKLLTTEKTKVQQEGEKQMSGTDNKSTERDDQRLGLKDLSKDDLLKLLGMMEGEIQAREDVIRLLRARLSCPEALESQYGSASPSRPLQALQRDGHLINDRAHNEDVYEKPMAELDRLQYKHRETYRRMLEQLLLAERSHRRTVQELDTEKRKHADYMDKSDDFTNLLEQERERLKLLLKQEKAYQVRKEQEHSRRLEKVRGELIKLKTFALMLVDEQQLHLEQIDQQSQKIQELLQKLQEKEQELSAAESQSKECSQKLLGLEVELEVRTSKFARQHDEMTAKLATQETQHRQLSQKQAMLSQKIQELEGTNGVLQKSAEELQELKDKISKGECGHSNLMAELESLRQRVLEMESKDEEIANAESQCAELKKKLHTEGIHNKELKLQVEKLQKRMMELEKLEAAFSMGRTECAHLQDALEKEQTLTKEMSDELVMVKIRMKELESSELKLEKAELVLKEELMKLKSVTVIMVNEHKNMAERIRSEEKKREELDKLFKKEQEKVTEVTERLIDESKRFLKLKSEMEAKITALVKEKGELQATFAAEEEKCKDFSSKVCARKHINEEMKDGRNESTNRSLYKEEERLSNSRRVDEKIVVELTMEIERLRNRLKQLEVVEGDLIKTEDEYDVLEKKFQCEQEKARSLTKQVEEMRRQIAFSKAIERGEAAGQETELWWRCRLEQAKNRDLQSDVQALKEKIHEFMNKEDLLSQLQVDFSILQQKFLEEEDQKKSMSSEVLSLTKELEMTKRYSRALRPSVNGRRMRDAPVMSTGVQTDAAENKAADDDDTPAVFIKKSVQEENHIMCSLRQRSVKKPAERPTVRELYPPPAAGDLTMKKSWIPWIRRKDGHVQSAPDKAANTNGETVHSEIKMTQKQGHPLHIRVTPDHQNSKTTLQISSSPVENVFSNPVAAPSQRPQITVIPSTAVSPNERAREPRSPERARSPMTITTISRAKSPESVKTPPADRPTSPPVSFTSVSTSTLSDTSSSPEPQELITGRAVFKVTPEKRVVPTPIKKCNSNANIITTDDNKIHIHLGSQFKKPCENSSAVVMVRPVAAESRELSMGTVLRSPRQGTISKTSSKVTSSITITQVNTAPARPTLPVQPVTETQSPRCGLTRIPMSRGMKAGKAVVGALGLSTGVRMESKAESQSVRVEVKKPTISCPGLQSGSKG
ncbi:filamin A interacting protein 1a [Brachyhypopomus gauderio]|uniref:filamin A interacting protein 1a n=1 Tax=Brachyhypopomus gauderio TaxID=698409 RepID=UPI00404184CE